MCRNNDERGLVNIDESDICDLDFNGIKEMKQTLSPEILHAPTQWVPRNIAIFTILHAMAAVGGYHMIYNAKWQTLTFVVVAWIASVLGITAGAHRLWSHRSFRAARGFRIVLMIFQTMAVQNSIVEWVRDHRCHHKWTDSDADPHNASRGLFFSHVGWLLQRKHPAVKEMGGKINMDDIRNDPVVAFQEKYYLPLVLIFGFLVPTAIPVALWAENAVVSFFVAGIFRYILSLHDTWTINSFAHHFGYKPYNGNIMATENALLAVFTVGEGGHNYHHTFPYDYRTSEYEYAFNLGKVLIDLGAYFGQVTERRVVSQEMINKRVAANTAIYGKCEEYEQFLQNKAEKAHALRF